MVLSGKVLRICLPAIGLALGIALSSSAGTVAPAPSEEESLPAPRWLGLFDIKGKAGLKWIPDPRYQKIRIFRRRKGDAEKFEMIAEVEDALYIDNEVTAGSTYIYRLAAVGEDGLESLPSAERRVLVTASKIDILSAPKWEGYLLVEEGVGLKWARHLDQKVLVYNVYRKIPGDEEYLLVGSSSTTAFQDRDVVPGQTYVYALTALDTSFRESPFSSELEVLLTKKDPEAAVVREAVWRARRTRLVKIITGGRAPFFRPADVAVGPLTGRLYVSDTGNAGIQVFSAEGSFVRSLGGSKGGGSFIGRPLGLDVSKQEDLYVVDGSQNSVAIMKQGGGFRRWIGLTRSFPSARMGLIDIAVGLQGKIFVVDNSNNRVSIAIDEGPLRFFGEQGFQPGQLNAPTFCTFDTEGLFYLSDALNARVQVFDSAGNFVRAFGKLSQEPGGLWRPKGIAVSDQGEVFVADSWQNIIQVFDGRGEFVAVLTDEFGKALDLGSPNGIALGGENRIYIVERLSNRLQIREILDEP
jgi:DNA-binding beta-propeller fold protein YncE